MKLKPWMYAGSALLLVGGLIGWKAIATSSEADVPFTVETIRRQDVRESVTANGEIQALSKVNVGTTVTGEIKQIHVKDGQTVRAGDLLVTLDQERFIQDLNRADLSLRMARQDQDTAEATFKKQEATFQRQEALFKQSLISVDQFQDSKLARDSADIALQRAKVAVQQAQAQVALSKDALDKTVLRAPMTGRVTGLKAEKGEMAIAGQTNLAGATLMVISDMGEMLAEAKVGELEVSKLRAGQPAEVQVDALPGLVFQAKVFNVANSVDRSQSSGMSNSQEAQNYKVRVQLEGSQADLDRLRPGMSARVAILANEIKQTVAVPLQSVLEREERSGGLGLVARTRTTIFVVKDGVVEERTLKLGASTRRQAQVLEGVKEGEQVITGPTKGLATLATGKKVKLAKAEATK
ncbi:efflux RND transporter periplasmic adaptor subunit [Geothrix sp. PMB-07]|uniref:efflux RND transporter periplasmic adaptor subunit n=1 Tax=Geothrix sp. PMB-07 TaxID=3068640 RepID=UPI0027425982|nr:efflux RND transporter periplasmic adaptor subunit [Geothrix sp. PMB-07]WLT32428.1 efflux RND transporter periplasmic adaptor subunit [Geothrix sp. PMB-07]